MPWVVQQHEVQIVRVQVGKRCLHLAQSGVEAMVARVQLCGEEQSGAWNAAVVYGLSYQVLSIPLRSLKHHVAVRLHALNQLGGEGVMMMDRGVVCEGGGADRGR